MNNYCLNGIMGLCVGDALGVPVEFYSRKDLDENPVTDMRSYGSHNQPKGTWSDDTSMTLCLMQSLLNGLNYYDIAKKFHMWLMEGYMTPYGRTFDNGIATFKALLNFEKGIEPLKCGGTSEDDNGNGSLMRILPMAFYLKNMDENKFNIIKNVSSITHAHPRSFIACCIYVETAIQLINGLSLDSAFEQAKEKTYNFFKDNENCYEEIKMYKNILLDSKGYKNKKRENIKSSGYVVDTLDSCMWCLFCSDSYKTAVLNAVNLGDDTDTVGAVTGGLAGIIYGYEAIPKQWLNVIAKKEEIETLCNCLYENKSIKQVTKFKQKQIDKENK